MKKKEDTVGRGVGEMGIIDCKAVGCIGTAEY